MYMQLYELQQSKVPTRLEAPRTGQWSRGAVVSQAWANLFDDNGESMTVLCFGTALGWLVIWHVDQVGLSGN